VSFRLVMFRPFVGEVLVGKISGYDEKGLHVSLDFFNDICIPGHLMQYGTARALDGRWMLKTEDGDELYLDLDDEVYKICFFFKQIQSNCHCLYAHGQLDCYADTILGKH
ncbi:Os03g0609200, partial [Oryza sativa Japonica Group]